MTKTIILIHGRAEKPAEDDLKEFWTEALRFGLEQDHPGKVAAYDAAEVKFVYYGDESNKFLNAFHNKNHDLDADAASRRVTLDELKARPRTDFLDQDVYDDLPGKTALKEAIVDAVAGIAALFRVVRCCWFNYTGLIAATSTP